MSTFFPKIGVFNPIREPKHYGIHIPKFKISFLNILVRRFITFQLKKKNANQLKPKK